MYTVKLLHDIQGVNVESLRNWIIQRREANTHFGCGQNALAAQVSSTIVDCTESKETYGLK